MKDIMKRKITCNPSFHSFKHKNYPVHIHIIQIEKIWLMRLKIARTDVPCKWSYIMKKFYLKKHTNVELLRIRNRDSYKIGSVVVKFGTDKK